jgi:hypothetical protein
MIIVRYPNGFTLEYGDAHYAVWEQDGGVRLWDSSSQQHLKARVLQGSGATIEFVRASNAYDANSIDANKLFKLMMERLKSKSFPLHMTAELKTTLTKFDGRRLKWKP